MNPVKALPVRMRGWSASREALERVLAPWHAAFDEEWALVRLPAAGRGYHSRESGWVHPLRESARYALAWLMLGRDVSRAERVIATVLAHQDRDEASPTWGVWPYQPEEPLAAMRPPDLNWACFLGTAMLDIRVAGGARLSGTTRAALDDAVGRAARAAQRRAVGPAYTNIAIMSAGLCLLAGHDLGDEALREHGRERLLAVAARVEALGGFDEYNSPTYTTVTIVELSRLRCRLEDAAASPAVEFLHQRAWAELADHFHASTGMWAGPHSRCYETLPQTASWLALVRRGTGGAVALGPASAAAGEDDFAQPLECPEPLWERFRPAVGPRTVTLRLGPPDSPALGQTYLHHDYTMGSVTQGDLWAQRRPLLAYWATVDGTSSLRLRCLKDGHDLASAQVHTMQCDGNVAGVVTLSRRGGERHLVLDWREEPRFRLGDLRVVFEVEGAAVAKGVCLDEGFRLEGPAGGSIVVRGSGSWQGCEAKRFAAAEDGVVRFGWILRLGVEAEWAWSELEAGVAFVVEWLREGEAAAGEGTCGDQMARARLGSLLVERPLRPLGQAVTDYMRATGGDYVSHLRRASWNGNGDRG